MLLARSGSIQLYCFAPVSHRMVQGYESVLPGVEIVTGSLYLSSSGDCSATIVCVPSVRTEGCMCCVVRLFSWSSRRLSQVGCDLTQSKTFLYALAILSPFAFSSGVVELLGYFDE